MNLSHKAFLDLSKALAPEVVSFIEKDERYAQFMMSIIPEAIKHYMGEMDSELSFELSCHIMDSIYLDRAIV